MAPSHQRWRQNMRKPRDFDSELKSLADKAKQLKERGVRDLGALVTATGADALDADVLAGALGDAAANTDKATGEGWSKRGEIGRAARRERGCQHVWISGGAVQKKKKEGRNKKE